jgi:hypothetical protein
MFGREPAMILGAIQALLALGLSFGLHLSPGQFGAIMAAAAAVLSVVVRQQVTPIQNRTVANSQGDPLQQQTQRS